MERFTMDAVTDGERAWCVADPHPDGEWVLFADLATPAPREDGYSAGVRAAAEAIKAADNGDIVDALNQRVCCIGQYCGCGGAGETIQQHMTRLVLALLDAPALPDARAAELEAENARLKGRLQAIIDWSDMAQSRPDEFSTAEARMLRGPIFDDARSTLAALEGASR